MKESIVDETIIILNVNFFMNFLYINTANKIEQQEQKETVPRDKELILRSFE